MSIVLSRTESCHSAGCCWGICRFNKHKLLSSAHEHEHRERKWENYNRHLQLCERSQLSYRGRNRAHQLVVGKESVDFIKHTLLSSAYEQEQRDSATETIEIVAHKICSAVNCPIEVGIVPLSRLMESSLLISQSTHCCHQHTNTNREKAQTKEL